jgi:IS6 family transposase
MNAWDTKPEAHQEDVPTPRTDTQNVFLCRVVRDRADVRADSMSLRGSHRPTFSREVIAVGVRWYLRYGPSYRDVEELLAERGIWVDHVTVFRCGCRRSRRSSSTPPGRPATRWETGGLWMRPTSRSLADGPIYRAVDQHGQVIDVLVSSRRDVVAPRRFFARALRSGLVPVEVVTDRAPVDRQALDELAPLALHVTDRHGNNVVEADHGRLKARLWPMRGLKRLASVRTVVSGHAFVPNLRRGHDAITTDLPVHDRVRGAFDELALALTGTDRPPRPGTGLPETINATAPAQGRAGASRAGLLEAASHALGPSGNNARMPRSARRTVMPISRYAAS